MRIILELGKSVEENAGSYFDKAKRLRKKIDRSRSALEKSIRTRDTLQKKLDAKETEKANMPKKLERRRHWYEKFRWFISSEGFLVIGGRDATTNEIIIKKHAEPGDLVFHTDMAGSPFFIIKSEKKPIGNQTVSEAANATVSFSRAWKMGLHSTDTFHVTPDQVTKKTRPGEYMGKGAFMIEGRTTPVENKVELSIGAMEDGSVMAGPRAAVEKHCKKHLTLIQGRGKSSDAAKKISRHLSIPDTDAILRALPSGGVDIAQ